MPQIYNMGPTALLPLWRKARWGFFRQLQPGLNPRTWVLKASTLPLDHRSRNLDLWNVKTNKQNNPAVYRDGVLVFGVPCDTNNCSIISFFVNNFAKKSIIHLLISSVWRTSVSCYFNYFSTNFPPYFLLQWKRHRCRCFVTPGCYLGAVYHDSSCDVARPLVSTTWHSHQWGAKIMETLMMMVLYWSPYWLIIREWGRGLWNSPILATDATSVCWSVLSVWRGIYEDYTKILFLP